MRKAWYRLVCMTPNVLKTDVAFLLSLITIFVIFWKASSNAIILLHTHRKLIYGYTVFYDHEFTAGGNLFKVICIVYIYCVNPCSMQVVNCWNGRFVWGNLKAGY